MLAALPLGCRNDTDTPVPAPAAAPAPEPRAHLKNVKGDVKVKRVSGDDWMPAQEGLALYENDKVSTMQGAGAQIVFTNGGTANMGENSLVGIAETRTLPGQERTDLTLEKGQVEADLPDPARQSLSVATPAATVRAGREIVFQ
jgi:hypothetical protein